MKPNFVKPILEQLMREGLINKQDTWLTVAADQTERNFFQELGYPNVTISNLNDRLIGQEFAPYDWSYQDAQNLSFEDNSYDFVFVSDGLHHCEAPHRALLEMYRVARKGIFVFEARDSMIMNIAIRFKLTSDYEVDTVIDHNYEDGGVNNSQIPNFIYRWTEREFEKTIKSYNPTCKHTFRFFYGMFLPYYRMDWSRNVVKTSITLVLGLIAKLGSKLFKKQCNSFAMVALKPRIPEDLYPWLAVENEKIVFEQSYISANIASPKTTSTVK